MKLFKNYGLSLILGVLFLTSWIGQGITQWMEYSQQQSDHLLEANFSDFLPFFLSSTLENWQSEFLQLLTFVVLTSFLIHKGSHESKDSDEEMKALLEKIDRKLTTKSGKGLVSVNQKAKSQT